MTDMLQNILAATDFSKTAERASDFARELSRRFQAELHLLHVVVILEDPHLEEDHRHRLEELVASEHPCKPRFGPPRVIVTSLSLTDN